MKRFFILVSLMASLVLSCDINDTVWGTTTIKYEVTGTAETVDVTYENEDGGTSQKSEVSVPWSTSFTKNNIEDYVFMYISAQNNGRAGNVTVTIYTNGDKLKTSTSEGAFCIATASGSMYHN